MHPFQLTHTPSPSPSSFAYFKKEIINCYCFHLQAQNILFSDMSVGHLMYVFSCLFLNRKPITGVWLALFFFFFFFFFFWMRKLRPCWTVGALPTISGDERQRRDQNHGPELQSRIPDPCSCGYPTLPPSPAGKMSLWSLGLLSLLRFLEWL